MSQPTKTAKDMFLMALDVEQADRAALLDVECAEDIGLRRQVEQLLKVHDEPDSLLDSPRIDLGISSVAVPEISPTIDQPITEKLGTVIGPYKLLQQIGEGGFGVVYMADQAEPVKRRVALKIIKPGMDTRQVIARFEAERQALAMMDHPNISKVFDAGATDSGRPYFVMELVKGVPITRFCDQKHLTPRERLELFVPVCQALQHAHQKGIIHRDIKPSNVLVAKYGDQAVPKIIDFGIVKAIEQQLTEKTMFTQLGQIVGTIDYMSPEQAELNQFDVDTRSDIYSLGVLLYELLTGETPFDRKRLRSAAFDELLRIIREEEPPKPSLRLTTSESLPSIAANRHIEPKKLTTLVRGELDWIVMKALEKDRTRRYETANGFAADIERYLNDEPVVACPPSATYRFRKFARRNKRAFSAIAAVVVVVLMIAGGIGWVVGDRAARLRGIEKQITSTLDNAEEHLKNEDWPQVRIALTRAEGLASSTDESISSWKRAQQIQKDLETVDRLDTIRLSNLAATQEELDERESTHNAAYERTFREYGIDTESLSADEAAEKIRSSLIRTRLLAALGSWSAVRRGIDYKDKQMWSRPLKIARLADPDDFHKEITLAWQNWNLEKLLEIAETADIEHLPPVTVGLLANGLFERERSQQQREAAIRIAQRAQRRHRSDFWLNYRLCSRLRRTTPPRPEEALRYGQAALALRPSDPQVILMVADTLRELKRFDEAIATYREAIELDPKNWRAHNNLGLVLANTENVHEAIAAYRKAIELQPDNAKAYYNLGLVLVNTENVHEAIAAYRKAIELQPDYAAVYYNLGNVLANSENIREAIKLQPDGAAVYYNPGGALAKTGNADEAIAAYRKAIELQPDYADAHNNLGRVLAKTGKEDEAIAEYRKVIELQLDYADAYNNLGLVLVKTGKDEEAIAEFRKVIELQPDYAKAHNNLGVVLVKTGKDEEAIAEFRKAIELQLDDAGTHNNLGNVLSKTGKDEEAIAEFRKAIELQLDDAGTHNNLGNVLSKTGKEDEAIAEYRKAIELDPTDSFAHNILGNALSKKGQLEEAIAEFRTAIALNPKDAHPHYNLALTLANQRKLNEAIDEYRTAIELDPKFAHPHNGLGNALRKKGQLEEAIDEYRTAIELDPKFAHPHNGLGNALADQGKLEEAIDEYRTAIELNPKDAHQHNGLGNALRRKGKLEEAIAEFRTAIALNPKDAPPHYNLALTLTNQRKLNEAIDEYRTAIELNPKNDIALNHLAWLLVGSANTSLQDAREGVQFAQRACEQQPTSESTNTLGVAYYRARQWPKAIEALQKSIDLGIDHPVNWLFIAMSHWQLEKKDESRKWYAKSVAWREKNKPTRELQGFFVEAEKLLGVGPESETEPDKTPSANKEPHPEKTPPANGVKDQLPGKKDPQYRKSDFG